MLRENKNIIAKETREHECECSYNHFQIAILKVKITSNSQSILE